jgi:D-sedoheptulose 7-phosphate isomerase
VSARPRRTSAPGGPLEREARAILTASARSIARTERRVARTVAAAAEVMIACLQSGGTVFFCGNGGSAADAQHFACELSGRFLIDRPGLAAVALTTNTSALTAIGNDFGFEHVFARQLEGLATPGDVLVAITTSGGSPSVIAAVETAHRLGLTVIGMTGERGARFARNCDLALVTPSPLTPRVQEGHLVMGHAFCELIERALFPPNARRSGARARGSRSATGARRAAPVRARPARRTR